jgi:hypothetical protein
MTPFGRDVVPLVYIRIVVSSSSIGVSSNSSLSAAMRSSMSAMSGCATSRATKLRTELRRGRSSAMTEM